MNNKKRKTKEESNNYSFIFDPNLEPYYIEKDQYCYTIRKKNEDGSLNNLTFGHYTKLETVLKRICSLKQISGRNYETVLDYINEWNKVHDAIKNLVNSNI